MHRVFVLGVFANDQSYSIHFSAIRPLLDGKNCSYYSYGSIYVCIVVFAAFLKTCFGIGKRGRTDQCNRDCEDLCRVNPRSSRAAFSVKD